MNILALDISAKGCSVALSTTGGKLDCQNLLELPKQQSEVIFSLVIEILARSGMKIDDIDYIAWGRGPGSFTGLRLVTSIVQGLSRPHKIKLIPVSSLQALALRGFIEKKYKNILACIDARKNEIYWSYYYGKERIYPCSPEQLGSPNIPIPISNNKLVVVGSGTIYFEKNNNIIIDNSLNHSTAEQIIMLAKIYIKNNFWLDSNCNFSLSNYPIYLRNKII